MKSEPKDGGLPASTAALQKIADGKTWAIEMAVVNARSRRMAWWFAAGAGLVALAGMGSATAMFLQPPPAPKVLVVDKTTGETMVLPNLDGKTVPQVVAMDLNNASAYVVARETYNWSLLRKDYDQVARMSTPQVFAPYSRQFIGPGALQEKLADKELRQVTVINARPLISSDPGRSGEVVVTYEREIRNGSATGPQLSRHVATIRYEYRPNSIKRDEDRLWNPFGFVVTAYRSDAEVAASRVETQAGAAGEVQ